MREIKFRGMDLEGRWFYGLPCVIKDGRDKGTYISNKAGVPKAYDIRPETLSQFTGLFDKEGVEIYEGDILEAVYQSDLREVTLSRGVVTYYEEDAGFFSKVFEETKSTTSETITRKTGGWDKVNHHTVRVIGNIYENNDLLL